jgi:hypothetical protein
LIAFVCGHFDIYVCLRYWYWNYYSCFISALSIFLINLLFFFC